jgi:MFS family permease
MPNDTPLPAGAVPSTPTLVKAVVASTVGSVIEWYDFFLYGTAAALVFPRLFFPQFSPFVGQILAFLTFLVGFVARPLGGLLFGYLGDRVGRKSTLIATLLLMGISTMLIGVLPTASRIGPAAAIVLTALRFLQGLGVGGEWGGSVLLALEYGHRGGRGFLASWPQTGVPLGLLISTGVLAAFEANLSEEAFLLWGWRVPFLLSGVLIAVGFFIRTQIAETPLFAELKDSKRIAQMPLWEALGRHWHEILLAAGIRLCENSCFYLFTAYIISYGRDVLHVDPSLLLGAVILAAAAEFVAIPIYGMLSDLWSRRGMYALGCVLTIAFAFPYYLLLETRVDAAIVVAVVLSLVSGHAILYSVQASWIPELFGTRVRYTGASLGYQLGAPLAGGLAPIIAATLVETFGQQFWPLALYIIFVAVVSLICVHYLAETVHTDLSESR